LVAQSDEHHLLFVRMHSPRAAVQVFAPSAPATLSQSPILNPQSSDRQSFNQFTPAGAALSQGARRREHLHACRADGQ